MMNRSTVLRAALAGGVAALALAGCGQMRPSQKMDIYEARMTGAQEVPPVNTAADGTAEIQLNTNTNVLTWKVTYTGLSGTPTGGHIHGPAAPGPERRRGDSLPERRGAAGQRPGHDHADAVRRPRGGPVVREHPHGREPRRRDPRPAAQAPVTAAARPAVCAGVPRAI